MRCQDVETSGSPGLRNVNHPPGHSAPRTGFCALQGAEDVKELSVGEAPGTVTMAWLLDRADRAATAIVPIVGPRTPEQVKDYTRSLALELAPEHYRRLDEVSASPFVNNPGHSFGGESDRFKPPVVPAV
ncbi:aldo/keto reductase [Streptomyces sp. NPDC056663]|uniref:aldo/keto reductase n=1 Tax=Streptomyces sp. NPDC056663 TaxID=3345899 RepID=UPI0036ABC02D